MAAAASRPSAVPMAQPFATGERAALLGLAVLLVSTAAWWALALWPLDDAPPAWLARARWVCFNAGASGLPAPSGWLLLIGEPLGLGAALFAAFGRSLRGGLRSALATRGGRAIVGACAAAIALGLGAAAVRVASATSAPGSALSPPPPSTYPRLDRPAPALGLVDQSGERIDLAQLRGRPALVTFAFAHCETVCPALVRTALGAQARVRAGGAPAAHVPRVAIVTLDPWRDTPKRLPALANSWQLPPDGEARVLSGEVSEVNALLDRWNVARVRNETTGQLDHPALVYVLDAEARIAYAATGDVEDLVALLGRL